MRRFTDPLDNIRIASPCKTNWDQMFGDDRKRFCGECKLNVYNLSAMTRQDAENLLFHSEGRLCVKFYRRRDGSVITENCPVGWRRVKWRVGRLATSVFALLAGFVCGVSTFEAINALDCFINYEQPQPTQTDEDGVRFTIDDVKIKRDGSQTKKPGQMHPGAASFVGRVEPVRRLKDEPVVAWIE